MEDLGHKIKRIDQLFKMRMNQNLEQFDITIAQMSVLIYLFSNRDEKITQKKLSEHFGVKHSTMSGILCRLKEKDLIEIRVDENNKKYRNIYTTEKAMLFDKQMNTYRNETEELLVKGFSNKEIELLRLFLDRLYYNLLTESDISEKEIGCFNKRIKNIERRQKDD